MRTFFIISIHIVALIGLLFFFFFVFGRSGDNDDCPGVINTAASTKVTLNNFEAVLSENQIIKDLPESSTINLVIFNDSLEKDYVFRKNNVSLGKSDNADIVLKLPMKYLDNLTSDNFCEMVKAANINKDLSVDVKQSMIKLLIQYRSILKYKDCLGL